jgi:hypothetical protein
MGNVGSVFFASLGNAKGQVYTKSMILRPATTTTLQVCCGEVAIDWGRVPHGGTWRKSTTDRDLRGSGGLSPRLRASRPESNRCSLAEVGAEAVSTRLDSTKRARVWRQEWRARLEYPIGPSKTSRSSTLWWYGHSIHRTTAIRLSPSGLTRTIRVSFGEDTISGAKLGGLPVAQPWRVSAHDIIVYPNRINVQQSLYSV